MESIQMWAPTVLTFIGIGYWFFKGGRNLVTKEDILGIEQSIDDLKKEIEQKYVSKDIHDLTRENLELKIKQHK